MHSPYLALGRGHSSGRSSTSDLPDKLQALLQLYIPTALPRPIPPATVWPLAAFLHSDLHLSSSPVANMPSFWLSDSQSTFSLRCHPSLRPAVAHALRRMDCELTWNQQRSGSPSAQGVGTTKPGAHCQPYILYQVEGLTLVDKGGFFLLAGVMMFFDRAL